MALNRPLEAIKASQEGLSRNTVGNTTILDDTLRKSQRIMVLQAVSGLWIGVVDPLLGGYEQFFEFHGNSKVVVVVQEKEEELLCRASTYFVLRFNFSTSVVCFFR